jgi:hypothetical protein
MSYRGWVAKWVMYIVSGPTASAISHPMQRLVPLARYWPRAGLGVAPQIYPPAPLHVPVSAQVVAHHQYPPNPVWR